MKLKANTKYEWSQDKEEISGKIHFIYIICIDWSSLSYYSVYFILVYFTYMAMECDVLPALDCLKSYL